jgi:hypothetical protein
MDLFKPEDVVFTKDSDGEFLSGGFSVNSLFLKLGMSPLHTLITKGGKKDEEQEEEEDEHSVSKLMYDGFAVPVGLLCERRVSAAQEEDYFDADDNEYDYDEEENTVLSDDLYDKLLGIQTETNAKTKKKKMTRRRLSSAPPTSSVSGDQERKQHKKTRKHKLKEEKMIK